MIHLNRDDGQTDIRLDRPIGCIQLHPSRKEWNAWSFATGLNSVLWTGRFTNEWDAVIAIVRKAASVIDEKSRRKHE